MDSHQAPPPPLSSVRVNKPLAAVNRLLAALHAVLAAAAIAHRALPLLHDGAVSLPLHHVVAMVAADVTLLFIWALSQAAKWRPVTRAAFPERLRRSALPGVDVMVVTADPDKEPTLEVMNMVVSAMALDYPGGRLSVYLSDDAGSPLTLLAARKAYAFARAWVPFCRKYKVQCPCPSRYLFFNDEGHHGPPEETQRIKKLYESLTEDVLEEAHRHSASRTNKAAHVEIIADEDDAEGDEMMPLLVYVSREKRMTSPHHFKAGALNVLTRWKGLDGLQGPILSGTGFYARRDALYGATPSATMQGGELCSMERRFGRSEDLGASVRCLINQQSPSLSRPGVLPRDAELVASCAYEETTGWGHQVGFLYQSVVEDYFTGYRQFFCRGWTSVYCYPTARPAFLGNVPTNLNDVLVQNKRWMSGLLAVGLSKHCPLLSSHKNVSVLQSMSIAYYALVSVSAFPVLCYATLPQLCFFRGVPLFPSASFAAAAFVSSSLQHLIEASVAKRRLAVRTWWNEQRFWMLNAVTGQLFACITVFLDLIGAGTVDFELTSKASDDNLYRNGVFDLTGCSTLLLPATTLSVLNVAALVGGTCRKMTTVSGELLPELFLMCYVAALSYPLLEGMFLRQDAARVPGRITALSVAMAAALLAMFG